MARIAKKEITWENLGWAEKQHLESLGFKENIDSYFRWCKENGFRTVWPKKSNEFSKEKLHVARIKADEIVRERRANRDPLKLLAQQIEDPSKTLPGCMHIASALHAYTATGSIDKQLVLKLLEHVGNQTDLLERNYNGGKTYSKGLVGLIRWANEWIRPIEEWEPKTHNAHRQYSSLVRHLYAKYDVPAFLDKCWFEYDQKAQEYQLWFIHIGSGGSVRNLTMPIEYTKKMAHHFLQAPEHYSVEAAIRHGQIIAMGGDDRLSEYLCATRLGNNFENEDFWVTVIRWFIRHPMIDPDQIAPITDFIYNQRFVERRARNAEGQPITLPPEPPNLTMKDRDPATMLKEVEKWHKALAGIKHKGGGDTSWAHSQYKDWELEMGEKTSKNWKRWRVYELLTSQELFKDGREMHHCVYSYARSCESGRVSVWSMELDTWEKIEKQLTIEVRNGMIVQARGKYNARATPQQAQILGRWATAAGLNSASYL